MSRLNGKVSPEYSAWLSMKDRCYSLTCSQIKDYKSRGITVCDHWRYSYNNFLNDMGRKPFKHHQLDRVDNNGNYGPDNCRWATHKENGRNTRVSKWWIVDGITYESKNHAADTIEVSPITVKRWCEGYSQRGKFYPSRPNCYSEPKYK